MLLQSTVSPSGPGWTSPCSPGPWLPPRWTSTLSESASSTPSCCPGVCWPPASSQAQGCLATSERPAWGSSSHTRSNTASTPGAGASTSRGNCLQCGTRPPAPGTSSSSSSTSWLLSHCLTVSFPPGTTGSLSASSGPTATVTRDW